MASAKVTIDHETIRKWVEAKGGCPAHVKRTADGGVGMIRIDYPGYSGKQSLEQISWEDFFDKFEEAQLAFLYQDEKDTRFSKLVKRDSVDLDESSSTSTKKSRPKKASAKKPATRSKKKTRSATKKRSRRKSVKSGLV